MVPFADPAPSGDGKRRVLAVIIERRLCASDGLEHGQERDGFAFAKLLCQGIKAALLFGCSFQFVRGDDGLQKCFVVLRLQLADAEGNHGVEALERLGVGGEGSIEEDKREEKGGKSLSGNKCRS
jgi:hypothetical protein